MDEPISDAPAGERAPRVGAILLAAGRSTRMGGPDKLLATIDGEPMVRRALRVLQEVPLAPVAVVLGVAADAVRAALAGLAPVLWCSADHSPEQQVSVVAGLRALPSDLDAILVMLSDQPLLDAGDLRWLVARHRALPAGSAAIPVFEGRRGNPVVIDAAMRAPILAAHDAARDAAGVRGYLAAHPERAHRVEAPNDHFVVDIDTPADLERLAARGLRIVTGPRS